MGPGLRGTRFLRQTGRQINASAARPNRAGASCHCEERSDAVISGQSAQLAQIAASLCSRNDSGTRSGIGQRGQGEVAMRNAPFGDQADRRRDWRRTARRGPRRGPAGQHDRRDPPGAARSPGDLLPRPATAAGPLPRLRAPLRPAGGIPVPEGHRRLPRDHHRRQAGARDDQLRRRLALRHHLPSGTADGDAAGRARGAGHWRRHAVRQPVPRIRNPVGWHEAAARRTSRVSPVR